MRIGSEVEMAFSLATREAAKRHHEHVTLEHLAYALLFDSETAEVVRHAGGDVGALKSRFERYLDEEPARSAEPTHPDLSLGFQRVVGRAAMHVQTSGRNETRGPSVLVAMFAERDCPAVAIFAEHGVTRYDLVNYVSHGVSKGAGTAPAAPPRSSSPVPPAAIPSLPGPPHSLLLGAMFTLAGQDAARRGHSTTTLAHILYSLLLTDEGAQLVRGAGADLSALKASVDRHLDTGIERAPKAQTTPAPLSPRVLDCLERLGGAAEKDGARVLQVTDMLVAIARETEAPAAALLREHGLSALGEKRDQG